MLGIVTMAGNALRSFGSIHPAIKWGVVAIVGLLAVEFVGREAISLYVAMQTAPYQITQAKEQAEKTRIEREAIGAPVIVSDSLLNAIAGHPKDAEAEATRGLRKAADAGDASAMYNLATIYWNGNGVTKDRAEAARWYRKAADAGEPHGMFMLGVIYEYGDLFGMTTDMAEAKRWYRKAADAGDDDGLRHLQSLK